MPCQADEAQNEDDDDELVYPMYARGFFSAPLDQENKPMHTANTQNLNRNVQIKAFHTCNIAPGFKLEKQILRAKEL